MNGPMTSDPEVCPLIDILATSGGKALTAIRDAWSEVRGLVWKLADRRAPDAGGQVTVDLDGVLVVAHSDKQDAAPIWKKTYGHHPLRGFVGHGPGGTGEPVAALLRPGNAGSNTAAGHIEAIHQHVLKIPASVWTPAIETGGAVRDAAWVAALVGDLLDGRLKGMRLIVRKERPHLGAQLGPRRGPDPGRAFDRASEPAPARHRPEPGLAGDRTARVRSAGWMPMLALTGQARLWEPQRLRFRLFSAAAQLVTTGRLLLLTRHWPWTAETTTALSLRESVPVQSSGTRPLPETTLGPSACPPSATESEAVRRLRRRTVTKDRGQGAR